VRIKRTSPTRECSKITFPMEKAKSTKEDKINLSPPNTSKEFGARPSKILLIDQ
jgi:hypothetical protein